MVGVGKRMPLTAIQSRIAAFESLANPKVSPSPSPPNLGRKTSLIDLQDWVVDHPLAPPLPPRKQSLTVEHTYPPLNGHAPASSISSFHSVSLSDPTAATESDAVSLGESYEEVSTPSIITSPATQRNISIDWERAMAKQKQAPPKLPQRPSPSPSRTPSSSSIPSISRKPPPPPPRSSASASDRASIHSTVSTSTATSSTSTVRSAPHLKSKRPTPVPPAARLRYDALFNANIIQRRKADLLKPKEKPALLSPAEARGASRRARAGWRGLSVDLITSGPDDPVAGSSQARDDDDEVSDVVGPAEKLEGHLVRTIWRRSRLGRKVLREVWNECDPDSTGSLNRDQFATGMWRLDEELRRAQLHALKSTNTATRSPSLFKSPPPPIPSRKPILR
ncbi:hypothetical protein H0H92_000112 [Tricholoma furcatifolium]|nr:hypothetical protein H0H92_000112 [Tricholoma furcatifolium]